MPANVIELQIQVRDDGSPQIKQVSASLDELGRKAAGAQTGALRLGESMKGAAISGREMSMGVSAIAEAFGQASPALASGAIHASRFVDALTGASTSAKVTAGAVLGIGAATAALIGQFTEMEKVSARFAEIDRAVKTLDIGSLHSELTKTTVEMDKLSRETDSFVGKMIVGLRNVIAILPGVPTEIDAASQAMEKLRAGLEQVLPFFQRLEEAKHQATMSALEMQALQGYFQRLVTTGAMAPGGEFDFQRAMREQIQRQSDAARAAALAQRQREFLEAGGRGTLDIESPAIVARYEQRLEEIQRENAVRIGQLEAAVRALGTAAREERIRRFMLTVKDQPRLREEAAILGGVNVETPEIVESYRRQQFIEDQAFQDLVQRIRGAMPWETGIGEPMYTPGAGEVAAARARRPGLEDFDRQLRQIQTRTELLGKTYDPLTEKLNATRDALEKLGDQFGVADTRTREMQQAYDALSDSLERRQAFRDFFEGVTGGITGAVQGVIQGTQTIEQAFANMGQAIALGLMNTVVRRGIEGVERALEQLLQSSGGFLGSFLGGAGYNYGAGFGYGQLGTNPELAFAGARGGILPGSFLPIQSFASGGIVSRPTLGLIGEGRQREAVVPLPDGRAIPAVVKGGGDVIINVQNQTGLPIDMKKLRQRQDTQGRQVIDIVMTSLATNPDFRAAIQGAARG